MVKRSNLEVIKAYLNHETRIQSHTGNLWISADGTRLFNYATCLAERNKELDSLIINRTSYSNSTSKIQSWLLGQVHQRFGMDWANKNTILVDDVQMGSSYLEQAAIAKMEWAKGIKPVKLINYFDVWGNKKDGWEINNLCEEHEGELELHEDATNKDILQLLKNVGFFKSTVRINMVEFEVLHDFGVEIYQKKDMKPICRIEWVHNQKGVKA